MTNFAKRTSDSAVNRPEGSVAGRRTPLPTSPPPVGNS